MCGKSLTVPPHMAQLEERVGQVYDRRRGTRKESQAQRQKRLLAIGKKAMNSGGYKTVAERGGGGGRPSVLRKGGVHHPFEAQARDGGCPMPRKPQKCWTKP